MGNQIQINPEVLRNAANRLSDALSMLDHASAYVSTAADGVEDAWQSRITPAYVERVREVQRRIQTQRTEIGNLWKSLRNIADTVEQTEREVSNIIQNA